MATPGPAPTQMQMFGKTGIMQIPWVQWFARVDTAFAASTTSGGIGGDIILPIPYTHPIIINGADGVGLLSQQTITGSSVNSFGVAVSGIEVATAGIPNTGGVVGGSFLGMGSVGGLAPGNVGEAWGITSEAWNGTATTGSNQSLTLVAVEAGVIQQFDNNTAPVVGINTVFRNRAGSVPFNGVGSNRYSNNSRAIFISSQARSGLGEFCGWSSGIYFDAVSMDLPTPGGTAIGIDMHNVQATKMGIGLWLPDLAKIVFSTAAAACEMKYDGGLNVWGLTVIGSPQFAVSMGSGQLFIYGPSSATVGAAGGADALPAAPLGYMVIAQGGVNVKVPYYNT